MKRIIALVFLSFLLLAPPTTHALTISNDNYILQMYPLIRSLTPTPPPSKTEPISFPLPFGFTLSQDSIDFGILSPTNPISRTIVLSIKPGEATGYSVSTFTDKLLTDDGQKISIPSTHCDTGVCTHAIAGTWENILTYGLGFRCDNVLGNDCTEEFSLASAYKQFTDIANAQIPQPFMIGFGTGQKIGKITLKLNISRSQAIGIYKNNLTFIIAPNL